MSVVAVCDRCHLRTVVPEVVPLGMSMCCQAGVAWYPSFEPGHVYQGESLACLRALESDTADALITDSPYSSGGFTRGDRNASPADKYCTDGKTLGRISFTGDNRDSRSWAYWCALWLSEAFRVVKPGGYALIFTDWRMLPNAVDAFQAGGFLWRGLVSWNKGERARAPHTGYFRHQAEFLVWGSKGPLAACEHGGPWPGVWDFPVVQADKFHMTGKPTELLRELVKIVPKGGLIVDPFAGSGTTLVACEMEKRRGIGFELEPENVAISNRRIEGAREALDGRAALEGQRALFQAGGGL